MSTLTKPQARVTFGWAKVNGARVPVEIDIEWDLFLSRLEERAGGTTGPGTVELAAEAFEDAGIEESKAIAYTDRDNAGQAPPFVQVLAEDPQAPPRVDYIPATEDPSGELGSLRAELHALRTRLEGIEQGQMI